MPQPRLSESKRIERIAAQLAPLGPAALKHYQTQKAKVINDLAARAMIDSTTIYNIGRLLRDEINEVLEVKDRIDRGQYGALENGLYWEEIANIWRGFCIMHDRGNKGWSPLSLPGPIGTFIVNDHRYGAIVKYCLVFKPGHGWSLKEQGRGWAETLKDMFPRALGRFAPPVKKGESA